MRRFDESRLVAEDLDFARRLRAHGTQTGRRFTNLRTAPIVTSCRKFDRVGDWHMFAMALQIPENRAAMKGTDTARIDRYLFDFNAEPETRTTYRRPRPRHVAASRSAFVNPPTRP